MTNNYIIYLLTNTSNNNTYIGITNNKIRRIRQHNGDLVGGAKYTKMKKGLGEWQYEGWIEGEINKSRALSLEKKIQIKSRRITGKTPLERRLNAINYFLSLEENNDLNYITLFESIHK
jgi:putative endonuclease